MNKLYVIGSVFIGIGALLAYHAGRQDMVNEIKAAEAKRWEEAARVDAIDHSERDPVPE